MIGTWMTISRVVTEIYEDRRGRIQLTLAPFCSGTISTDSGETVNSRKRKRPYIPDALQMELDNVFAGHLVLELLEGDLKTRLEEALEGRDLYLLMEENDQNDERERETPRCWHLHDSTNIS